MPWFTYCLPAQTDRALYSETGTSSLGAYGGSLYVYTVNIYIYICLLVKVISTVHIYIYWVYPNILIPVTVDDDG